MKKIINLIITLLCIFPFFSINAISNSDVNYTVKKYYVKSELELAGALHVREVLEVDGTFNGYFRNIFFKNNLKNNRIFSGVEEDFKGSSIYNGTDIMDLKVGILEIDNLNFNDYNGTLIDEKVKYLEKVESATSGDKGVYTVDEQDDGVKIKIFNEVKNGKVYFFLDYLVANVTVEHNDSAEFYYNFISEDWNDKIEDVRIMVLLPFKSKEVFKIWGHGQLDAKIVKDKDNAGVLANVTNYIPGSGIDIRMLFDKSLFPININDSKKSNMDAIKIVEKIENERATDANKKRIFNDIKMYLFIGIEGLYILSIIIIVIYVYFRRDKEYKSNFFGKYYRDFIEDYNVENIEYLMTKNVTERGFSTSLLNLIYKKAIIVEEIKSKNGKKDYKFIKNKIENISDDEKIIIDIIFDVIGDKKEVLLSSIKKVSKKVDESGNNELYIAFTKWKDSIISKSKQLNFYEDNTKLKIGLFVLGLLGLIIVYIDFYFNVTNYLMFIVGGVSVLFIFYILCFKKRTIKGNDDYHKWKAFKNFLNDFGRFKEKELPEIKLWERYLVYASIFGLADKVQKSMNLKFNELRPDYNLNNGNIMFNYFMFSDLSSNISGTINNSIRSSISAVTAAKSQMSSGSGAGGGFSSGGGFGGGGNSGGGF